MLKQKALTQKLTATLCTSANTVYIHKNNIPAHKVYTSNSKRVIRNLTKQQQSAFKQLPQTYLQNAKARYFPHSVCSALAKYFA